MTVLYDQMTVLYDQMTVVYDQMTVVLTALEWTWMKSALRSERSASFLTGMVRKISEEGKGVLKKKQMLAVRARDPISVGAIISPAIVVSQFENNYIT